MKKGKKDVVTFSNMISKTVIKFWMRELFCDLKLLPCVFFLCYVMGSKGNHYTPVVREKESQGEE